MDTVDLTKHLDNRLKNRLRIFLAITVALLLYVARLIIIGDITLKLALLGIAVGIAIGYPVGRLMTIVWREKDGKAVYQLDVIGIIALACFVGLDLSREWIFSHWLSGPILTAFTLCLLAGGIFGRFLGMGRSVKQVLDENVGDQMK